MLHGLRSFSCTGVDWHKKISNLLTSCQKRSCLKFLLAFIMMAGLYELSSYYFFPFRKTTKKIVKPESNYFKAREYYENFPNILKTSTCAIPDLSTDFEIDPWMQQLVKPKKLVNCTKSSRRWTYVNGTAVIVDEMSIGRSGSAHDVKCCYRDIRRLEQSLGSYSFMADSLTSISGSCFPLHNGPNEIAAEFIRVECFNVSSKKSVYRNYHAFLNASKNSVIRSKISKWQTRKTKLLPPNVVILGIDALSRANFRRTMNKTAESLISLGAVELLGYMKVADCTFPNIVPLLSGLTIDELSNICGDYARKVQDKCPYIWKDFNSSNYLTAHLEDTPWMNTFTMDKIGFLRQQVDFYLRPFMLQAYEENLYRDCIGPDRVHEKVFRYLKRLMQMASDQHVPFFSFIWLGNLAHEDMNSPAAADESFSSFFRSLDLGNTILFFMSDHGPRYGPFRRTHHGWYEDKLPNVWLYLPPSLRQQKPTWMRNLALNSKRVSSHFDAHQTLRQILKDLVKSNTSEPRAQPVGQSLFEAIPPNRTCNDAHVGDEFCACQHPHQIPIDGYNVKLAAYAAISRMNSQLSSSCARLSLQKVIAAASSSAHYSNSAKGNDSIIYIVTFMVRPGQFLVEATVKYNNHTNSFKASEQVSVVDKIGQANWPNCVHDPKVSTFCHCL